MRVVVQRVSEASVSIEGQIYSQIQQGMLILLGIENKDSQEDIDWLCKKIANLRIFSDENGEISIQAGASIPGIPKQQFKLIGDFELSKELEVGFVFQARSYV